MDKPFVPPIEGGTALIAGGTSGVGLATAKAFAERGLKAVVLMGRDAARGEVAVKELSGLLDARFVRTDASVAAQAMQGVEETVRLVGELDFLVCSTVPTHIALELLHRAPIETFAETLQQFVLPPLHLTRAVLDHMRERGGGAIVNVASDAAKVPTPGESVIGAAMAGIVMFTRAAALESKRDGVRVNAVTPSLISGTPTTARVTSGGFSADLFAKAARAASLGVASPQDVAEAIVFLCDPRSARTTGQVLSVNGGISVA